MLHLPFSWLVKRLPIVQEVLVHGVQQIGRKRHFRQDHHFSLSTLTRASLCGQPCFPTADRAVVYSRSGAISRLRTSRLPQNRFSLNLVLLRAINRPNKIFLVKPVEIKCQYLFVCVCVCVCVCFKRMS